MHELAQSNAEKYQEASEVLLANWATSQEKIKKYYDKHHKEAPFGEGDWVMLSAKNIKLKKAMKKLSDQYIGPFQVDEKIGNNAFRLILP